MKKAEFFNLGKGEKIIKKIKPLENLKKYFLIVNLIIFLFAIYLWLVATILILCINFGSINSMLWGISWCFLLFIPFYLLSYLISQKQYNHQYYWITNKRILYKHGVFGYRISSIPYERVSDVIISRTFLERVCGFGSLFIQTLAGQVSGGATGAEGSLLAVENPEDMQELIFDLIKKKRKEERLTI